MPPAIPVSAPPRVRDLLAGAPDGPVEVLHAGVHALYVAVSGRAVGVLAADAVAVPCGLRTRLAALDPGAAGPAHLVRGVLHLGTRPLRVGRTVGVHAPRVDRGRILCETASPATTTATHPAAVAGLISRLAPEGLDAVDPDAVRRLVGRGEGLTPLGDDVLCGWLATHRALDVPTPAVDAAVRAAMPATTLLSATLLDCALHGEVLPELGAWLAARDAATADALVAVGATSGAGILAGALLALRQLTDQEALAA